jgi:hypothetical protein
VAAAALLVWCPEGVDASVRQDFERASGELPERVRRMDAVEYADERSLCRFWSAPHTPADHVQRCEEPPALLAFVGNPVVAEGPLNWPMLLTDCVERGPLALTRIWPAFCAFFRDGARDTLAIVADRAGLLHVYVRDGPRGSVWASTSAFALAALGAELDVDATVEWTTAGHFISGRTFFRGIRQLGCGEIVELRPRTSAKCTMWAPTPDGEATPAEYQQAVVTAVEAYSRRADGLFFELTGGLDSRLLLAARLRSGERTRTWTVGRRDDVEMRTIERLERVEAFEHLLLSPDAGLAVDLPALIDEMHGLADGEANALVYTSLLIAFRGLANLRRTSITGSNGELARAFYWRAIAGRRDTGHIRGVAINALLRKIFRESGTLRFAFRDDIRDPEAPVREAVIDFLRTSCFATPTAILDDFYLRTRMRRFAGRNISTTSLFCEQGVPYFAHSVVDTALDLPAAQKEDGRVVREAIMRLSPALASVPLGSGDPVPPLSLTHPTRATRRFAGLARKAIARYGGRYGRLLARAPEESMPWRQVAGHPRFREYVRDLLLVQDARVLGLFDRAALRGVVESSLETGHLSPLGIVLTIELTLRRFGLEP